MASGTALRAFHSLSRAVRLSATYTCRAPWARHRSPTFSTSSASTSGSFPSSWISRWAAASGSGSLAFR